MPMPRPRRLLALLLCSFVVACASSGDGPPATVAAVETVAEEEPPKPAEPRYLIVHRNARLYLRPDLEAPFLQYRSEEAQAARDAAREEAREAHQEKEAERAEKRAEREAKRAERLRKRYRKRSAKKRKAMREREQERAERRRREEAKRKLRHIDREARRWAGDAPHEGLIVLRLVEREGDWIAAETITAEEEARQCYRGAADRLNRMGLRVWVRASEVLPVTTRRVRVGLARGAEMTLPAGVALRPRGKGRYTALVDGFEIDAKVDEGAIDTSFAPRSDKFEAPRTDTVFTAEALADGALKLTRRQALPHNPWHDLYVTATLWIGRRFYVTTQTPCGEYTVRASEEDLEPAGRPGVQRFGGEERAEIAAPYIRADVALYDSEGHEIGRTASEMTVDEAVESSAQRRCFQKAIWEGNPAEGARQLVICVDREAVVSILDAADQGS